MVDYSTDQGAITVNENSLVEAGVVVGRNADVGVVIAARQQNIQFTVAGDVIGRSFGIRSEGQYNTVLIQASGSVVASRASFPVAVSAVNGAVYNYGSVQGGNGIVARFVVNTGRIIATDKAVEATSSFTNYGLVTTLLSFSETVPAVVAPELVNYGTITGERGGIVSANVTNDGTIVARLFGLELSQSLANYGSIRGEVGVRVTGDAAVAITNTGDIVGEGGVALAGVAATGALTVANSGRIVATGAGVNAVESGRGDDTITNSGAIVGGVALGEGRDRYDGTDGSVSGLVDLGAGEDTGIGGAGVDRMNGGDQNDTLSGNGGDDVLSGGRDRDTLDGGSGDDQLNGGDGNDTLTGGSGNDRMTGGAGEDTYYVDAARDLVIEAANGGKDIVYAAVSYRLRAGQEVESLIADPAGDLIDLNLAGNEFQQLITGDRGDNRIEGGGGADTLVGLGGDDTYIVSDGRTVITETAGGGTDLVVTAVSYSLGANVENMRIDTGATGAINLTGNNGDNLLVGNAGANIINGGGGADTMNGGAGDDVYFIDNSGDLVIDGSGRDTVVSLISYTLGQSIENLSLAGGAAINGTGNAQANTVSGNNVANVLAGHGGLDTLFGGGGADTFLFDTAVRPTNLATITDFVSGTDRIALDDAIFAKLGVPGVLDASFFSTEGAVSRDDYILYDQATGALSYDRDGSGKVAAVVFAYLSPDTVLTAADIIVV